MQPLKTKTCWELSRLFVFVFIFIIGCWKEGETTFRSFFAKILLVVVVIVVVYSSANFSSVRKAANTAFNFACACNFPHSSRDLLGKRRYWWNTLRAGRGGRSDALLMQERKEWVTSSREPIPSNEEEGVAGRKLPACVDDEHIELGGSHWANDKHWQPELFRRIHRD